ncbi:MAG: NAD(P)/FAD-dependent oxidoreductase [Sphingomonadaceae bacterium]|nr:NAD(P)/FAD-dependent oxidoreductase [Sphingomonadaceae bacterium]
MSTNASPDARSEELHRKYIEERNKRISPDREAQYIDAQGDYSDFAKDPYTPEVAERDPVSEEVDVLVVGAGFGGMLTGMNLLKAGIDNFRILDMAGDFGGTWYWNRYPGVRCDIEAYIYLPRLEEVGTVPSERYVTGAEIFEHSKRFARHFGLYDHALLQTRVERMVWDDEKLRWTVTTNRGDTIIARFITVSQGPLAIVKLPGIPGIRDFKGEVFHSARWDYEFTGGSADGGCSKLAGKSVGVIGTGATAVQIVPTIADDVEEMFVFQRTPSAVAARNNHATDVDWFKGQPAGWQAERADNFAETLNFSMPATDLLSDCWTDFFNRFKAEFERRKAAGEELDPHDIMQAVDYDKMDDVRAYIEQVIEDKETAEAAKPWYNFLCKRPLYSDDFLESFNKPNVHLVNTDGRGVERVTADGLVANGQEFPLDVIVFATGYEVGAPPHKVGEYEVEGRGGKTLDQKWNEGFRSIHGTKMSGFPNFQVVGQQEQGIANFNYTTVVEIQSAHAVGVIERCLKNGYEAIDFTRDGEDRWVQTIADTYIDRTHFYEECTPGFLNNEGNFKDKPTFIGGTYGPGPLAYRDVIAEWLDQDFERDTEVLGKA